MRIGTDKYHEYMKSEDWGRKRDKVIRRDRRRRTVCGTGEGLHAHHKTYERLGHEQLADLTTLCDICHHMAHKEDK
jgi:5-methylcytosine-specific restriction endonuclease McrA